MWRRLGENSFLLLVIFTGAIILSSATNPAGTQGTCPWPCHCSRDLQDINCEGKRLNKIPSGIPTSAKRLILSKNAISSIPSKAFSDLKDLTYLSLKENVIPKIHPEAFQGLRNLKSLFLTKNKLESLDENLFLGLESLEHLYIDQNSLGAIPTIKGATGLLKLGLATNNIQNATFPPSYFNLTALESVTLSENPIKYFRTGDVEFLSRSSITRMSFSRCNLQHADPEAFSSLTKLTSLILSYNLDLKMQGMREIMRAVAETNIQSLDLSGTLPGEPLPSDIFTNLSNSDLISLRLSQRGNVGVVQSGTFSPLSKVKYIYMNGNQLQAIQPGAFEGAVSLIHLDLSHNRLSKVEDVFTSSIVELDLSHNNGITLTSNTFLGASGLKKLLLSNCGIDRIPSGVFVGLYNLTQLDLSHNEISGSGLAASTFQDLYSLESLLLNNNNMGKVTEYKMFQNQGKLTHLDFSHNECYNLPATLLQNLKSIERLDLSNNRLGNLLLKDDYGDLFKGLSKLQHLDITFNDVSELPGRVFRDLISIQAINMSRNIYTWDDVLFNTTRRLQVLDISNNKVAVVQEKCLTGLPKNSSLNLSGNPFACSCGLIWFRNWLKGNESQRGVTLVGVDDYRCASPAQMNHKHVMDFHPEDIQDECFPLPTIKISVGSACGAMLIIVIAVIIIYR